MQPHNDHKYNKVSLLPATLSAGRYIRKHLQTMHLDIVLFLCANTDLISPELPAFILNENIDQSELDYETNHWLEIADCHRVSSKIDDNMQNELDAKNVFHPLVCGRPLSQETIADAGRVLSNVAS
ncbi:hypothetical protein B9Z19DRAFT_1064276 [Tuber borchii]|uniref:Uncharacterized protein n=1 Tax=Tuber borchii TaxID=42251 RepID=A0A2T6ZV67_TUBBO|nr:hypothetical protein B9Z19DRAFT_1064276 [Tuber borchii]